jgi:hypothetical protein
MFLEYIEGSSNNKALEIANKTNAQLTSAYSIKNKAMALERGVPDYFIWNLEFW